MKFEDAVAAIEEKFGAQAAADGFPADEIVHVASGGAVEKLTSESPTLSIERETAIKLWFDSAMAQLGLASERRTETLKWRFLDGPHCDKWRITIQDEKYTHRIAADRYCVICSIGLAGVPTPEAKPEGD